MENFENTSPATATPAPAPAPALLTMAAIRRALPDYFGRDAVADAQALTDKNQKYAPLCATLAGYAVERAQSGNANGLTKFDAYATTLKHAQAAKMRALCAYVQGIKPATLKSSEISTYDDFAQSTMLELLALVAPKVSTKAKAERVDWKAVAEQALAERDALKIERDALAATLAALTATPAPAPAPAPALT